MTRTPDSPRRDFRKEAVVESQEEQSTKKKLNLNPKKNSQPEDEVKSEPQEEQPPEDEKNKKLLVKLRVNSTQMVVSFK